MILSEQTIQAVRDASISSVVGHYVQLKQRGVSRIGLCPFHQEKSPSFNVSETKGVYKCFGCGAGGDHIDFVMKVEKMGFIEACEKIASIVGIPLEYEEVADPEKYEQEKAQRGELKQVLQHAVEHYRNNLWNLPEDHPVIIYLYARKINRQVIAEWQLGWATEDWHHISGPLINKGWYDPATKLGLIKRTQANDSNYDGYRSRITIPITNRHGEYIGLGGRFFEIDPNDKGKQIPKYINSPENDLYNKSTVLFGLSRAEKGIQRYGFTFLVEGYFDVISMHNNNDENTVGTCGTALTDQQVVLLKKYTNHVVVLRDGDDAGKNAAVKDLHLLLRQGFKVDIVLLPKEDDPDSFTQKIMSSGENPPAFGVLTKFRTIDEMPDTTALQYLVGALEVHDALLWQVGTLLKHVDDSFKLAKAQEAILHLLCNVPNDLVRNNYFDTIVKKNKWKGPALQKQLNELLEKKQAEQDEAEGDNNLSKMPKWMDRQQFMDQGYCSVRHGKTIGYYGWGAGGKVEITNFLVQPLFHVYAGKESRHLIQIDNGRKKAVLDIESKALVSPDVLQQAVVCEGAYIIYGNKSQWLRIANNLLSNFPRCLEVKFLGWQQAGFFAFVDKVYLPGHGLKDLDEWGILKHADNNYLVPAASAAYRELQETGEDPYENDRVLAYRPAAIKWTDWAKQMNRVYLDKGPVAIAYIILTVFRDIVFEIDNNCPHLYGFGERSSGKSKWAESIMAFFFTDRPAFNLNSGTDFAFFRYMQQFINCVAALNEFDEKIIKPEWFQAIKGIFDGEGRQRGVMGSKNRTEIMKIRSTLVLTGQYLVTMDDNSVVSRSLIEGFNERELTDQDKKEFDKLKEMESAGLSSLVIELLQLRASFKEHYRTSFNETLGKWRRMVEGETVGFNQRIMQNWCHLFTGWKLASLALEMPIHNDVFEAYCKQKALHWSGFIRSSDTLSEFWNTLSFLVDTGLIVAGWDFKIQSVTEVKIRKDRTDEFTQQFSEPTKVLFIRMNNVHKHYQQAFRTRTGKEGMTMENLMHYFSSRKYFIGANKQSRFKRFITKTENTTHHGPTTIVVPETKKVEETINSSSYVFLYNDLGLEWEREEQPEPEPVPPSGYVPVPGADFTEKVDTAQKLPFA